MKIEYDDEIKEELHFLIRCLIFDAGKGIEIRKLEKKIGNDFQLILNKSRDMLELLGIEIKVNEQDNKIFITPVKDFYDQLENYNLLRQFQTLSKKHKQILTRFISMYISEGKNEPILKDKVRLELKDKFGIYYSQKDLTYLIELGYISIIHNKFLNIGWRLRNSSILENFKVKFLEIQERIDKKTQNI